MKMWHLVVALLFILLFVGGPDAYSHRLYQEFWDTGHSALFAGLVMICLSLPLPLPGKQPWWLWLVFVSLFCAVLGVVIEVIQLAVGRNFEAKDLLNNLLGGYFGLFLFTALQPRRPKSTRLAMYPLMLVLIVIVLKPLVVVVIDEIAMTKSFPVLSDFETPYELSRWSSRNATLTINDTWVSHGDKALRINLDRGQYPGITLQTFQHSWIEYSSIKFNIYNTTHKNLRIELKIFDSQHIKNGLEYNDRFNRTLSINPGWNDFSISLQEIQKAPKDRLLNLENIASFSLFFNQLNEPMTLYFDNVKLSQLE